MLKKAQKGSIDENTLDSTATRFGQEYIFDDFYNLDEVRVYFNKFPKQQYNKLRQKTLRGLHHGVKNYLQDRKITTIFEADKKDFYEDSSVESKIKAELRSLNFPDDDIALFSSHVAGHYAQLIFNDFKFCHSPTI